MDYAVRNVGILALQAGLYMILTLPMWPPSPVTPTIAEAVVGVWFFMNGPMPMYTIRYIWTCQPSEATATGQRES